MSTFDPNPSLLPPCLKQCQSGYELIVESCKKFIQKDWGNCSGFVKDVASDLGIPALSGLADDLVRYFLKSPAQWIEIEKALAPKMAQAGYFVVAGLGTWEYQERWAEKKDAQKKSVIDPNTKMAVIEPETPLRPEHGHVCVIIGGFNAKGYPMAYAGGLGQAGRSKGDRSVGDMWRWRTLDPKAPKADQERRADRNNVHYFYYKTPVLQLQKQTISLDAFRATFPSVGR